MSATVTASMFNMANASIHLVKQCIVLDIGPFPSMLGPVLTPCQAAATVSAQKIIKLETMHVTTLTRPFLATLTAHVHIVYMQEALSALPCLTPGRC